MEKLTRREREKQSRRNEILQAAWKVFASKDYDAATLDDIATAAELSKGTLYLYFQNKADLFFATLEMGIEKFFSIIHEIISSIDDPIDGLKEIIKSLLDFFEENAGFFRILSSQRSHFEVMHAGIESKSGFRERLSVMASDGFKMMVDYIQHGIDLGVFREVDPDDVAFMLLEAIRGFAFGLIHGPISFKPSASVDSIISILLDGIRKRD